MNKMSCKCLSLKEKMYMLEKIEIQPPNMPIRELAKIMGVSKNTISHLKTDEQNLRKKWSSTEKGSQVMERKRKKEGKNPEVDKALNLWFSTGTQRGVHVSGPMLKLKSEEFAKKMGYEDFAATNGWLARWKERHDIKFKKTHGEKASADLTGAEQWSSSKISKFLQNYSLNEIYNAGETGLFYRATPDGSLVYKHEQLIGSKNITVLCCCNAPGSDKKKKLLVIGKTKKPRCFKNLNASNLLVTYYANKNAWMTATIFSKWLENWDIKLQRDSRKILFLIDNVTSHHIVVKLKNIQIEFLPPNTTSLIQPLDMGAIKNLKVPYRKMLMQHILEAIEDDLVTVSTMAKDISSTITILQAIQFVADSWRKVTFMTIQNCFAHCGFKEPDYKIVEMENNETPNELLRVTNCEQFSDIDGNLPCCDNNTEDLDNEIMENITKKKQIQESESDDDTDDIPYLLCLLQRRKNVLKSSGGILCNRIMKVLLRHH